jgi:hypothetical protein
MKKLEDISKKNIFEVPEGYFDRLPGVIQSRIVTKPKESFQWTMALKYAIPVILLAVVGIFWFNNTPVNPYAMEDQLATVQEDQLSLYLNDADLTTDDLAETMTWSEEDLIELEDAVYATLEISSEELENVLNEF